MYKSTIKVVREEAKKSVLKEAVEKEERIGWKGKEERGGSERVERGKCRRKRN